MAVMSGFIKNWQIFRVIIGVIFGDGGRGYWGWQVWSPSGRHLLPACSTHVPAYGEICFHPRVCGGGGGGGRSEEDTSDANIHLGGYNI